MQKNCVVSRNHQQKCKSYVAVEYQRQVAEGLLGGSEMSGWFLERGNVRRGLLHHGETCWAMTFSFESLQR